MSETVSILITGSELLDGRVTDTNSRLVAEELSARGIRLQRVLVVDDDLAELARGLEILSEVSQIILVSGGMGPTNDDLTREAAADFLESTLFEDPGAKSHLEEFYAKRGRTLDPTNLKQALIPNGCDIIPNPVGTAPGFIGVSKKGVHIAALPGVPGEFSAMFAKTVLPYFERQLGSTQILSAVGFKVFGITEAEIGRIVSSCVVPPGVTISYRAAFPEVHVKLKGFLAEKDLLDFRDRAIEKVGSDFVFTNDLSESLSGIVQKMMIARKASLAIAESCTGGMLGEALTAISGSSQYFLGGVIAYDNQVKERELGVLTHSLTIHGAVSREVACEMASGIRKRFNSEIGISVTGVAGPEGGSEEKPVGTVFIGIADNQGVDAIKIFYSGSRQRIRMISAHVALDYLRRRLMGIGFQNYWVGR